MDNAFEETWGDLRVFEASKFPVAAPQKNYPRDSRSLGCRFDSYTVQIKFWSRSTDDLETAFSCQTTSLEISNGLPSLLRNVAQEIEKHV